MTVHAIEIQRDIKVKDSYNVEPAKLISGSPHQTAWNVYSDRTNRFHCGLWEGEVGKWRVSYTEDEFCFLIKGCVEIADEAGTAKIFHPGDAFVIPAGFKGTWGNLEPTGKFYAILEH